MHTSSSRSLRGQNSQEIINKDKSEFDGKNIITGNLLVKLTDGSVKKSLNNVPSIWN